MLITLNILKYLMMMMALKKYQSQDKINIQILILRNSNISLPTNNKDNNMIQINNTNKILWILDNIRIIITNQLEILNKEKKDWKNNLQILNYNFLINRIYLTSNLIEPKGASKIKMDLVNLIIQIQSKILLEKNEIWSTWNNKTHRIFILIGI